MFEVALDSVFPTKVRDRQARNGYFYQSLRSKADFTSYGFFCNNEELLRQNKIASRSSTIPTKIGSAIRIIVIKPGIFTAKPGAIKYNEIIIQGIPLNLTCQIPNCPLVDDKIDKVLGSEPFFLANQRANRRGKIEITSPVVKMAIPNIVTIMSIETINYNIVFPFTVKV